MRRWIVRLAWRLLVRFGLRTREEAEMADKKRTFLNVALGATRVLVPGVAQAEQAFRTAGSGDVKRRTVLDAVTADLLARGYLSNPAIVVDPEFQDGLRQMNDGAVKMMRAVERLDRPELGK